jgi:predicted DNA-binding transcriptional regulator AlpA
VSIGSGNPRDLIAIGFKVSEVADLVRVHRSTLWRYMQGREDPPERVRLVVEAVMLLVAKIGAEAAMLRIRERGLRLMLKVQPRPKRPHGVCSDR